MIDAKALTADARRLVLEVEDDLRDVLARTPELSESWHEEHRRALRGSRTSADFASWRDDHLTQVAVSWVLTTVFVRFLEDNDLVEPRWILGSGDRAGEALDAERAYFRKHPLDTATHWLCSAIDYLQELPATAQLVDEHAPLRQVPISGRMAERILAFWRARDDDGALLRDFHDPQLGTRFLGDLYQDLSEHAKDTYALLQTPEFVEEFILEQTMDPALAERPLDGFRLIDPTCGSGHFLLGAFARLIDRWQKQAPVANPRDHVTKALESVVGVDINAFAVAIARFRLLLAALAVLEETSLEKAPKLEARVYTGDSLLPWGTGEQTLLGSAAGADEDFAAEPSEDWEKLHQALRVGQYDAVVGNPPYILVKDKARNTRYRKLYKTPHRKYQLTVPFMERFFNLAKPALGDQPAGWTGQITSNAFMKREFGTKLIEEYLPTKDLQLVVDTSGAYVPGHGTPTVIIVGRNQKQQSSTVRAVLGTRGEPGQPKDPAQGLVWRSIADHIDDVGFENEFVTVTDVDRSSFETHPWSLTGGAAPRVAAMIDSSSSTVLKSRSFRIGVFGIMGSDDAMMLERGAPQRLGVEDSAVAELVIGEDVRDFVSRRSTPTWFPYDSGHHRQELVDYPQWSQILWPTRTELENRATFSGETYRAAGRPFHEWHQLPVDEGASGFTLTFAFVATHNHFVLDRGGKVFNRSAPVIKLPEGASEDEHLHLLGVLNSSTALFWLKQNSYPKGGDPMGDEGARVSQQPWSDRYEFTGTTLQDFPIVDADFTAHGRTLDSLASEHAAAQPSSVLDNALPSAELFSDAHSRSASLRSRMIAAQEELDWYAYRAYGITGEDLTYRGAAPEVALGERAFEIALARRVAAGKEDTAWFSRHRSTPVTEIPSHWPEDYRALVQRRLDLIESDRMLNLLERPEYKRRWAEDPWETKVDRALRTWLLDKLEEKRLWFDKQGRPVTRSVAQLADVVGRDEELRGVVELWRGSATVDLVKALTDLLTPEVVPYLAAWRLKPKSMDKFRAWQHTWQLQRREDAGEKNLDIPVPPKYAAADWRKSSYMAHRGKLDVPKERFIHYPQAGLASDGTLQLGWAGWNHFQQYLALAALMDEMVADGASDDALVPLIAGLGELLFWVEQWHDEIDPMFDVNAAEFARVEYDQRRTQVGASETDLLDWRPPAATRGRKAKR